MAPEVKFAVMAACIYLPLGLGHASRTFGLLDADVSKRLSRFAVVVFESSVVLMGTWSLSLESPARVLLVPVLGAVVSLGLLGVGFLASSLFHQEPIRRGAFLLCALMSNIGMSLGGFLCYLLFGMPGQSLSVVYTTHFMPVALLIGLMIATHYGHGGRASVRSTLASMARNPLVVAPTVALVVGLGLNVAGVGTPAWVSPMNGVAVYLVVSLHAYSIGLTLRVQRIGRYWREVSAIAAIKFVVGPLLGAAAVFVFGQWGAFDGLLWRVVVVEGAMPVAIFATIVSNVFDLDRDLANSAWLLTTLACVVVVPVLTLVTGAS